MNELFLITLFTISALIIIYHHLGYPLLLKWYAKSHPLYSVKRQDRHYKKQPMDKALPSITILVPAYNESRWIQDKIRNLACLDYPKNKLTIIIATDGCTDNTVELAHNTIQEAICADTHFEIKEYVINRGKIALINELVPQINSDLVALSDVSALISVDALLIATEYFHDKHVGVVNPRYQLLEQQSLAESKYWQYQCKIKQAETSLGSTIGSHGAFYLFRTKLFEPLAENTINDDFILPMEIIQKGYKAHYDASILALELEATNKEADFKRRLRISAGNMQQVIKLWHMFNPSYMGVAFAFFSGKGLRLITPYLMLLCLTSSVLLIANPIFTFILLVQVNVYLIALICYLVPSLQFHSLLTFITYLLSGHFANLIGGLRYLLGLENKRWKRIEN